MVYTEPKDVLTDKSPRHSKSAAISSVLGLSKAIIEEEVAEVPKSPSKPRVVMKKSDWQPLFVHNNKVAFDPRDIYRGKITFFSSKEEFDATPDMLLYAWGSKKYKKLLLVTKSVSMGYYQVSTYTSSGVTVLATLDTKKSAYEFAVNYNRGKYEL